MRLLDALDRQVLSGDPAPTVALVVVDNSPDGDASSLLAARQGHWPLSYCHEPQPGISHARNRALAALPAGTEFVAMIDDDEEPTQHWLQALLTAQQRSGADVVVGPTLPRFSGDTPPWIEACGFFPKPRNHAQLAELDPDPPAATCNVLVRASLFDDPALRFEPQLALSGGEDKLLFQQLKLRGCRFAFAPQALALEDIPAERANLGYMWREAYRRGTVRYLVKRRLKSRSGARAAWIALRLLARSLLRSLWNGLRTLPALGAGRAAWAPRVLAIADSLGTCAGVIGLRSRHYRPESGA